MTTFQLQAPNMAHLREAVAVPAHLRITEAEQVKTRFDKAAFVRFQEAQDLLNRYENGDFQAKYLVEGIVGGHLDANQFGNPAVTKVLKETKNYIHSRADFTALLNSCIELELMPAWELCTGCFENYVYTAPARDNCQKQGSYSLHTVKGSPTAGTPIGEGGWFQNKQFGAETKGSYCVELFGCGVAWTYALALCLEPSIARQFVASIATDLGDMKNLRILKMWAGKQGFNTTEFPRGAVSAGGSASYLENNPKFSRTALKAALKQLRTMRDPHTNKLICLGRTPVLVTGSDQIHCMAKEIMDTISTEKTVTNPDGSTSTYITGKSDLCGEFTICCDPYLSMVQTDAMPAGKEHYGPTYADNAWALTVPGRRGARNGLEIAPLRGFETPRLIRKAGNIQTVSGTPLPNFGEWGSMNQYYGGLLGWGGAVQEHMLWVLSTGDEAA